MKIWIVTVESHRFFDEFERSYLPLFNPVFGVYSSEHEANEAIWRHFGDEKYEYMDNDDEVCDRDGSYIYHDEAFKYTDKEHGGYAIYGIHISEEVLNFNKGEQ